MTDHQFKIRIKLRQPQPQSIEERHPETVEQETIEELPLDWQKISVALLLVGCLLGLLGYVLFVGDDESELTDPHTSIDSNTSVTIHEDTPLAQASDNLVEHIESTEGEDTENIERDANAIKYDLIENLDHVMAPQSSPDSDSDSNSYADPYPFPPPKPSILLEENSTAELPVSIDSAQEDHPQVIRAQLSHGIQSREPVDSISHVQLDQGARKSIYFFMQLSDLADKSVNVDWFYQNKVITTKTLQIGGKNWRTYASKILNKKRPGAWQVVLTDQSGNQLATRDFTVSIDP